VYKRQEIYDDIGKETIFRENWSKVFKISDEENNEFDQTNHDLVTNFLAEQDELLTPLPLSLIHISEPTRPY